MTDLTFEQIESAFPEQGACTTPDGLLQVSAQWMHDFARNIWAIRQQCEYPLCQSEAEQQRIAAQVHAALYTGARQGACDECGKKQSDGWALYCVDCIDIMHPQQDETKAPIDLYLKASQELDAATDNFYGQQGKTKPELLNLPLEDLLGQYWEIAYSEGKTGESRGTEAQQVLSSILAVAGNGQVLDSLPRYAEVLKHDGHFQLELVNADHKRALVYVDDLMRALR